MRRAKSILRTSTRIVHIRADMLSSDSSVHPLTMNNSCQKDKENSATGLSVIQWALAIPLLGVLVTGTPKPTGRRPRTRVPRASHCPCKLATASAWHRPHMLTSLPLFCECLRFSFATFAFRYQHRTLPFLWTEYSVLSAPSVPICAFSRSRIRFNQAF